MTLGQKLIKIRNKFCLTQEDLANILNVSAEQIIKWEKDKDKPNEESLQQISKVFGINTDILLNEKSTLPTLSMKREIDKSKYKNKLNSYIQVLKEYYSEGYEVYNLTREKKLTFIESVIDLFVGGSSPEMIYPIETMATLSDLSPYYLVKKGNTKLLVNIKNWVLEVIELPENTNDKKFIYGRNKFINVGKIRM